jgi:hypothetical protein
MGGQSAELHYARTAWPLMANGISMGISKEGGTSRELRSQRAQKG